MECSASWEQRRILRGYIHTLMRLDFDGQLPAEGFEVFSNCEACATSPSNCGDVSWSVGNAAAQRLCRLSSLQLSRAIQEAQNLLASGHRKLRRVRRELGKPCLVGRPT